MSVRDVSTAKSIRLSYDICTFPSDNNINNPAKSCCFKREYKSCVPWHKMPDCIVLVISYVRQVERGVPNWKERSSLRSARDFPSAWTIITTLGQLVHPPTLYVRKERYHPTFFKLSLTISLIDPLYRDSLVFFPAQQYKQTFEWVPVIGLTCEIGMRAKNTSEFQCYHALW